MSTRLFKQSATKMTKRYIQQHFNTAKCSSSSMPSSPVSGSVFERLSVDKNKRIPVQSPHERAKAVKKGGYKSVVRLEAPLDKGVRCLTEKMMCEIMTKWPSKKLERIRSFHEYIRPLGEKSFVVRLHFTPTKEPEEEAQGLVKKCKDALEKLCELLRASNKIAITEMKVEFLTTEQECWMYNAWDIFYTVITDNKPLEGIMTTIMKVALKRDLMKRLKEKEEKQEGKIVYIETMTGIMKNHVETVKEETGVTDSLKPEKPDTRSDEAFMRLRPNSAVTLTQMLSPGKKPRRPSGPWKPAIRTTRSQSTLLGRAAKRLPLTRDEYASIVSDGLRVIHHVIPAQPKSYLEWKKSLDTFQAAVTPQRVRNGKRLSTPGTGTRESAKTTTTRPTSSRRSSVGEGEVTSYEK